MIIRNKFNGYSGDGRRLYPGGGGGGQPRETVQTQTTIPEYAKPYVERMLGKAEAVSEAPYQAYGGQRVAEFTPLQQKAFQGAANLGPAQQIGAGTQFAGIAGLQGLGAGQQYAQQATSPGSMQAYMSPYMENALAPQLREASRRSAMEGQAQQAQAVRAGAFGGSRQGLIEAERQRNLGQLQSDIYGRGMQTAFEQARQAQQFGADLGLRGAALGAQTAGTLGQLGQAQFGQEQAAIQAQSAAGAQQQALEQQKLTQAYQDFLSQRGYPQQQLAFMSDILRGVPLSQSTQQVYTAAPPMSSQLAQLGLGAYGFSQLGKSGFFKEGGIVKGYADGGIASAAPQGTVPNTMNIDKLRAVLGDLSDEQLEAVAANASDSTELALVREQQALNARIRNAGILAQSIPQDTIKDEIARGIEAAPIPESMFADTAVGEREAETEEMASGGIVAFAKGKEVKAPEPAPESPDIAALRAFDVAKGSFTPEQRAEAVRSELDILKGYMGEDKTPELAEKLAKSYEMTPESKAGARAAAAFEAMQPFGESVPFATAFGRAGAIVGRNVKEIEKLEREAKREASKLRLDSARYERAEKRGDVTAARAAADRMEDRQARITQLEMNKADKLANIAQQNKQLAQQYELGKEQLQVQREQIAATRAGQTDFNRQVLANKIDEAVAQFTQAKGRAPTQQEMAQIRGAASESAAKLLKVDPYGAGRLNVAAENAVSARLGKDKVYSDLSLQLLTADPKDKPAIQAQMDARENQVRAEIQAGLGGAQPAPGAGGGAKAAAAMPLPKSKAELQTGAVYQTSRGPARWNGTAFEAV